MSERCVIFDMDGTLANNDHRRHHVETKPKNWAAFNAGIGEDLPNEPVLLVARAMQTAGLSIIVCTGREEQYRRVTETWMMFHDVPHDRMYMRPNRDYRPDHIVKLELLGRIRADGFDPAFVVDDRASVVAMWRAAGLTCLQCAPGDF